MVKGDMLIAVFQPVEGGLWTHCIASGGFIESRNACVPPSPRGSYSRTAARTALVILFSEGAKKVGRNPFGRAARQTTRV